MGSKRELCIVDCLSGDHVTVEQSPFIIGSSEACDWKIVDEGMPHELFAVHKRKGSWHLIPARGISLAMDGAVIEGEVEIDAGDHSIAATGQLFALRDTSQPSEWLDNVSSEKWYVLDQGSDVTTGPFPWHGLVDQLKDCRHRLDTTVVHCGGVSMGFFARHVLNGEIEQWEAEDARKTGNDSGSMRPAKPPPLPSDLEVAEINAEHGEFTCPVCWLQFDRGDVMNIAVHGSLRGDPMLGEAAMGRFHATRFNDRGQAVDAMNLPAPEQACPHCRRKLPPGFLDTQHFIFSVVGAPSSGKSYYLSVLVKMLQQSLFKDFGVIFRDADPSENVILTQMKTQLFSAGSPEDAFLAKTDLEGALYETLPRHGRLVRLPKPFVFKLSAAADPAREASLVFYDNAGEHFEPTRNSADSPGAQHIAVASGIFFLFDPLHNAEFRARLTGVRDPQLKGHRLDQQDVLLAETEVRMKTLLGLDSRQRTATPLAVLLGKCDTWLQMLEEELLPMVSDGRLHLANVKQNSDRLRQLLAGIAPGVVANAEAISSEVMYFAISPLGSSPVEFVDPHDGSHRIGPDPQKLRPMFVEVPTLWVLSRLLPDLVPTLES